MNGLDELIPTRKSLLQRLKDWSDNESWRDFFETYWRLIYRRALKAGLSDAEAQEVVQETMISVFKAMPTFEYRQTQASFKSWLLRLTNWRIVDQVRKRAPEAGTHEPDSSPSKGTSPAERIADPNAVEQDAGWEAEWQSNLMEVALERVKANANPKMYQMFAQCVFKERPVAEVARLLRVTPARVYLAKHRIGALLKKEIKNLQKQPLPAVDLSGKTVLSP